MRTLKYSISNWIYGDEPLQTTFERLRKYGYDGVELMGEPKVYASNEVNALCQEFGLQVLSIAGMYPWPTDSRDLSNADPVVRERAVQYLRDCVDFAVAISAPLIIVVPASVGKVSPLPQFETEEAWVEAAEKAWQDAVAAVREAAQPAFFSHADPPAHGCTGRDRGDEDARAGSNRDGSGNQSGAATSGRSATRAGTRNHTASTRNPGTSPDHARTRSARPAPSR